MGITARSSSQSHTPAIRNKIFDILLTLLVYFAQTTVNENVVLTCNNCTM